MISEQDRDALRAAMPEVLALRCGVGDLRRSFRCPSPAHEDRDPSARYYANDHTVHCFGCGRTWDSFSLLGELDGIEGFAARAAAVADLAGYRLGDGAAAPARRPARQTRPARPRFEEPRRAGGMDAGDACRRAFEALYAEGNEVGRRYLRWRGLDDDDVLRWGLGFTRAPMELSGQFRVFEPEALGFVVIPFWDEGFSQADYCMVRTISRGRVRNKEWRPAGLSTPLWMEWELSSAAGDLYVAEGLIDAMALAKVTGGEVMALGGTSNAKRLGQVVNATAEHLRPQRVVLCMDEDDEGRRARDRIASDLDALGVRHASMPPYPGGAKDADEWLMAGKGTDWEFELAGELPRGDHLWRTRWL